MSLLRKHNMMFPVSCMAAYLVTGSLFISVAPEMVLAEDAKLPTVNAETRSSKTVEESALEKRAGDAYSEGRYAEAAALYTELSQLKTISTQDDTSPLDMAARSYARDGQHEEAIEFWNRILAVPAAPGARPPGPLIPVPMPTDYRGLAHIGIAESYRARKEWVKALEHYRFFRANYPADDGCVPSGNAFHGLAVCEAICLENLGRIDEAIALYWEAALYLDGGITPHALRRLVDLYTATGQIEVLDRAIERESKDYITFLRSQMTGEPVPPATDSQRQNERLQVERSFIATFSRVRRFRSLSHQHNWQTLIAFLSEKPDKLLEGVEEGDAGHWQRREAFSALVTNPPEALPHIEQALLREPENAYFLAARLLCRTPHQDRDRLLSSKNRPEKWSVYGLIEAEVEPWFITLQFPGPLPTLRLPPSLPSIYEKTLKDALGGRN